MREFIATVSSKGQVTIPAEAGRHLGVGASDKVVFVLEEGGRTELRPARLTVAGLRGIVPALPGRDTIDFDDQIAEAMDARADRLVGTIERR